MLHEVRVARWALFSGVVATSACSLFVDTGGFSSGGTNPADSAGTDALDASATSDASSDVASEAAIDGGLPKYVSAVLADQPLLYYRFEQTEGPSVRDEMNTWPGSADLFVKFNAPGAMPGSLAIALDGKGSINAGSVGDFTGNQNFTVECWVKPNVSDDKFRHPMNKDLDVGGPRESYGLFLYLGRIAFERYVNGSGVQASTDSLPIDVWYHVAGTYDGTQLVLYVNGVQAKVAPDARSAKAKPVPFYVGTKDPTYGNISGAIDEVALYDKALGPERVRAHFDAAKP